MAPSVQGKCEVCRKTTSIHCARCACVDEDGKVVHATFYCSGACQKTAFKRHKQPCRDLQQLHRGSHLLREIFYFLREKFFDLDIAEVKIHGETIHFYELGQTSPNEHFFKFPESISDPKDKKALLVYNACSDVMFIMSAVAGRFFDGIIDPNEPMREMMFPMAKAKARTAVERHFWNGSTDQVLYNHEIWKVTLKTGKKYAVDVAGAQFRNHAPVLPLHEFETTFVPFYTASNNLGTAAANIEAHCKRILATEHYIGTDWNYPRTLYVMNSLVNLLDFSINTWEGEPGRLQDMIEASRKDFECEKADLMDRIILVGRATFHAWEKDGMSIKVEATQMPKGTGNHFAGTIGAAPITGSASGRSDVPFDVYHLPGVTTVTDLASMVGHSSIADDTIQASVDTAKGDEKGDYQSHCQEAESESSH